MGRDSSGEGVRDLSLDIPSKENPSLVLEDSWHL